MDGHPDDVGAAVWSLRKTIADLIEYRHTESDEVWRERRHIFSAAAALSGLVEDLTWKQRKRAAE